MTSFVSLASTVDVPELEESHLFMPAWGYGLLALCIFGLLFALLWAFRNTAERFGTPKSHAAGQNGSTTHGHGAGH